MQIAIAAEGPDTLDAYATIPIAFRIVETLDPDSPAGQDSLLPYTSRTIEAPIVKDYDAQPGNHPLDWPRRFDVRGWGVLAAYSGEARIGGAVVISECPDINMLDGRVDLALLWDIRVAPAARNRGVGTLLLSAAESWARDHGARVLKVETQNTNVPACRFYASHGFILRTIHRGAYAELPREAQLLWYKNLD
jgi:ribosomal protein S18 acetylase RimI-like enzyme